MAVKLRLRRMGRKKRPIYKIVAADSRSPRDGKFLEAVGMYNPLTDPHTVEFNIDRTMYWLSVGAQPTNTVKSLLSNEGILLKRELLKKGLSEEQVNSEMEKWTLQKQSGSKKKTTSKKVKEAPKEAEPVKEEVKPEVPAEETVNAEVKADETKEEVSTSESTAEVKGAASEENQAEKE